MSFELQSLLRKLSDMKGASEVIDWSSPVPFFGQCSSSIVATVGINPSDREFVSSKGIELDGDDRRFHTLRSLGLESWGDAGLEHANLIRQSCEDYFSTNPYDRWFRRIDHIISGTSHSFYNGRACHFDLVPFATLKKWGNLGSRRRTDLLLDCAAEMKSILEQSDVKLLVLNGTTVVERFSLLYDVSWTSERNTNWDLPRSDGKPVLGRSFKGNLEMGAGEKRRSVLVLGFNHNIQSSFGVTSGVITAIRDWISRMSKEHLL
jgi:hypothetical protein